MVRRGLLWLVTATLLASTWVAQREPADPRPGDVTPFEATSRDAVLVYNRPLSGLVGWWCDPNYDHWPNAPRHLPDNIGLYVGLRERAHGLRDTVAALQLARDRCLEEPVRASPFRWVTQKFLDCPFEASSFFVHPIWDLQGEGSPFSSEDIGEIGIAYELDGALFGVGTAKALDRTSAYLRALRKRLAMGSSPSITP